MHSAHIFSQFSQSWKILHKKLGSMEMFFLRFWLWIASEMTCDIWSEMGGEQVFWLLLGV